VEEALVAGDLVDSFEELLFFVETLLFLETAAGVFRRENLRLDRDLGVELVFLAPGEVAEREVERLDLDLAQELELEEDPVEGERLALRASELLELEGSLDLVLGDETARADELE